MIVYALGMRFPLVACAVLAACGDAPVGITVDFTSPAGVKTIELFVAEPCTKSCDGRTGPPGVAPIDGAQLWEVPNDGNGPFVIGANEAVLLVTDGMDDQTIEMLAAIGYDENGTAIAAYMHFEPVLVVAGQSVRWTLTLEPTTDIVPGEDAPDGTFRARRWKRSDALMPSCAIIEKGRERYAFGPVGDRDCDELTMPETVECAPWIHRADDVPPSGFGAAVCGTTVAFQPGYPSACLAGGRACSESGSVGARCTQLSQDFCVTPDLCNCPEWNEACLRQRLLLPPVTSYVKCVACTSPVMFPVLPLGPLLGRGQNTCSNVRMHELASSLGPLDETATFATSEIKITSKSGCDVTMEWSGAIGTDTDIAFVSLDLSNGKHVVVPLYVEYAPVCDSSLQVCTLHVAAADPGRWCAAPPPTTTCGPDPICGGGPWCGTKCCAYGERCDAGVCKCGTGGAACSVGEVCGSGTVLPTNCGTGCCGETGPNVCI